MTEVNAEIAKRLNTLNDEVNAIKGRMNLRNESPLFSTKIKKLVVISENTNMAILTNLLSYIYLRVNYKFAKSFRQFEEYEKFLGNQHVDGGIIGVRPNHDYSKIPLPNGDFFPRRKTKKNFVM